MDDKEKLEQHLETLLKENKITSRELVEMSEKLKKTLSRLTSRL